MRRWPLLGCLALAPILLLFWRHPDPLPGFPALMLWAWESPQDLRFLKPGAAGIAFLERTVWLDGPHWHSRPRLQPLRYTPGTALMAVVRFESAGDGLPPRADVVRETLRAVEVPEVRALQIDFDARQSERSWYSAFLRDLRQALPAALPLTITALESWCERDPWMAGAPVADATPMLFRMGPGNRTPPAGFAAAVCRSSVGVSTDELPAQTPRAGRIYVFHPGSWTQAAYNVAMSEAARLRR